MGNHTVNTVAKEKEILLSPLFLAQTKRPKKNLDSGTVLDGRLQFTAGSMQHNSDGHLGCISREMLECLEESLAFNQMQAALFTPILNDNYTSEQNRCVAITGYDETHICQSRILSQKSEPLTVDEIEDGTHCGCLGIAFFQ